MQESVAKRSIFKTCVTGTGYTCPLVNITLDTDAKTGLPTMLQLVHKLCIGILECLLKEGGSVPALSPHACGFILRAYMDAAWQKRGDEGSSMDLDRA
eukprot:364743-Chlamydomonas_euryale.AAC.29